MNKQEIHDYIASTDVSGKHIIPDDNSRIALSSIVNKLCDWVDDRIETKLKGNSNKLLYIAKVNIVDNAIVITPLNSGDLMYKPLSFTKAVNTASIACNTIFKSNQVLVSATLGTEAADASLSRRINVAITDNEVEGVDIAIDAERYDDVDGWEKDATVLEDAILVIYGEALDTPIIIEEMMLSRYPVDENDEALLAFALKVYLSDNVTVVGDLATMFTLDNGMTLDAEDGTGTDEFEKVYQIVTVDSGKVNTNDVVFATYTPTANNYLIHNGLTVLTSGLKFEIDTTDTELSRRP
jgi:hypothetical protein